MSITRLPVARDRRQDIAQFEVAGFGQSQAKLDALIQYGAKVKNWPLVHEAISAKIDDQAKFVDWWDRVNKDWGGNRSKNADRGACYSVAEAEKYTGIKQQQQSRWRKELGFDKDNDGNILLKFRDRYRARLEQAAYRKAGLEPEENHRAEGTGEYEWFTPEKYIAAARSVMGGIDLDPASHERAQQINRCNAVFYQRR